MRRAKGIFSRVRRGNVTTSEVRKMKYLLKSGLSLGAIGKAHGRDRKTVRLYCKSKRRCCPKRPILQGLIRDAVRKLRRRFPSRKRIGCRLVAAELGMSFSYIAKVMGKMTIRGAVKFSRGGMPNYAEDPGKVLSQGRSQGWC